MTCTGNAEKFLECVLIILGYRRDNKYKTEYMFTFHIILLNNMHFRKDSTVPILVENSFWAALCDVMT